MARPINQRNVYAVRRNMYIEEEEEEEEAAMSDRNGETLHMHVPMQSRSARARAAWKLKPLFVVAMQSRVGAKMQARFTLTITAP